MFSQVRRISKHSVRVLKLLICKLCNAVVLDDKLVHLKLVHGRNYKHKQQARAFFRAPFQNETLSVTLISDSVSLNPKPRYF